MPAKLVPYALAVKESLNVAGEGLLPDNKSWFIKAMVECCPLVVDAKNNQYIVFEDFKYFVSNINKFLDQQDMTMLMRKRGPKAREVDVIEFVESAEFMNMKGHVYPAVADALWSIWHDPVENFSEVVLTGCLSGDVQVKVRDKLLHDHYEIPLEKLFKLHSQRIEHIQVLCHDPSFGFRYSDVKAVVESGIKEVYDFRTYSGKSITATRDHRFLTPSGGYKELRHFGVHSPGIGCTSGFMPIHEEMLSLRYSGKQPTYDIIMSGQNHNFVANNLVVHNSTGIGKSFMSEMCSAYMLYKLSNYWDPQIEMDLAPGSPLYIVFQSRNERSATNILFRPFYARIKRSKYFREVFPFRKDITAQMIFPNEIIVAPFSGSDDAVLGLTVVGGAITELNRMAYVEVSKRKARFGQPHEDQGYDQAVEIHKTLRRRIVGRTMSLGKTWGVLVLDAAHEYGDDFTDRKLKEAEEQPVGEKTIYTYKKKQWEVRPQTHFSGKKFYVEVGTEKRRSRVLLDKSQAFDPSRVEEVPIEYKPEFDKDCEGALKDFAGISVASRSAAIPYKEQIAKSFEQFEMIHGKNNQLFRYHTVNLNDFLVPAPGGAVPDWSQLINQQYVESMLINKEIRLAGHVDPALNHCLAGIAVAHVNGWKLLDEISEYDPNTRSVRKRKNIRSPMVMIDGILAITSAEGEEIDLELLQSLGIYLHQNCHVEVLSIDSFQSAQMRQAWANAGIVTGHISVDDTVEPYTRLRSGYREDRVLSFEHPIYKKEILSLQFDGAKYNHLPNGSKDCSDAVAGAYYLAETHLVAYEPEGLSVSERQRMNSSRAGRRLLPRRFVRGRYPSRN